MRIRTVALVATAVAALALAAGTAAAHAYGRPGHGPRTGIAEHLLHMAKVLDLTDDQKAQIEAIAAKEKGGASGASAVSMRTARQTLAGTIHDPSATDDQVRDAASAVAALQVEVAVQRHRMAIQILSILTQEQKAKLDDLRASFKDHHAGPGFHDPSGN
jgi:Spy/CpxP family protein refolding chaperone